MRVLFFSSIFPRPEQPGRGIFCQHYCRGLVAGGHVVRVISPRSWYEPSPAAGAATRLEWCGLPVEYPRFYYPPGVLRCAYGWFMWASVRSCLRRAIEEFAPECLLSYWAHPDGAVALAAAHEAGLPSAVIVGGSDVLILPRNRWRRPRIVAALKASDAVITVSRHLRDRVVEMGVTAGRAHVVYQGIDRAVFSPDDPAVARRRLGVQEQGKLLLFIGNLVQVKGLDILLDACARLARCGILFRLFLVGAGPLRRALEVQALKLGIGELVTFVGPVAQQGLADWYRAADLFVLPSRSEGIPNVLRESMACGTPFVATDVGGIREIIDPRLGCLAPPGDAMALASAITKSLGQPRPEFRPDPRIGTWAECAEEMVSVIRPLVGKSIEPIRADHDLATRGSETMVGAP